jgi:hypothetical protein
MPYAATHRSWPEHTRLAGACVWQELSRAFDTLLTPSARRLTLCPRSPWDLGLPLLASGRDVGVGLTSLQFLDYESRSALRRE